MFSGWLHTLNPKTRMENQMGNHMETGAPWKVRGLYEWCFLVAEPSKVIFFLKKL